MRKLTLFYFCFFTLTVFAGNSKTLNVEDARNLTKNHSLTFIENKGQFKNMDGKIANNVLFKTSAGNIDYYITTKGLSFVFNKISTDKSDKSIDDTINRLYYRLDMELINATIDKANIILEEADEQGYNNYFFNNCAKGIYGVKGYTKITITNIYEGIDWIIYTNTKSKNNPLKYDFIVHPKADYKNIKIKYINAESINFTDKETKLHIETIAGNIEEGNIKTYQTNKNRNIDIDSKYIFNKDSIIEFDISNYNKNSTLIIDPLIWATYYGGTDIDCFKAVCTDHDDNIYITGYSYSTDFPTQQLSSGYWQSTSATNSDLIILKFNNQGVRLWATYYGGSGTDYGYSIVADKNNNIYITGSTTSTDFPTNQLSGAYWQSANAGGTDIILLKFNNQGVRLWATYYGGTSTDIAYSICTNSKNDIYITGYTFSSNLPKLQLAGAYWQTNSAGNEEIFILKFNDQGVRQWATFYGGTETDIAYSICTDSQDNILITGYTDSGGFPTLQLTGAYWQTTKSTDKDAFIMKYNSWGVRQWVTFYGGNDEDYGTAIKTDSQDNIYVAGRASSTNLSMQQMAGAYNDSINSGGFDIFILKFTSLGVRLWATFYGGSNNETVNSIGIDLQGSIYLTGESLSSNFPTLQLSGEFYKATKTGTSDAYILKFCNQGVREWATYYGSKSRDYGTDITFDSQNNIYFVGVCVDSAAYTVNPGNGAYYNNIWNNLEDGYILKVNFPSIFILNPNIYTICSKSSTNILLVANLSSNFTWTIGNITQGITGASAGSGNVINQILTNPGTTAGIVEYIITPTLSSGGCPAMAYKITVIVNPKPSTPNIFHN